MAPLAGAPSEDLEAALGVQGQLPPPQSGSLVVADVTDLGPSLRQIRFRGRFLQGLRWAPGQDLMLRLPQDGEHMVNRRYSIRRADPYAGRADINVVMHGNGPAARWAREVRLGQLVPDVVGPRGKITLDPAADWHLFIGDDTYLPATLAMLEALPPAASARALLEVGAPEDEQPLETAASAELEWLHRGASEPGAPEGLVERLERLRLPDGRGHVYIAAELRVALRLRDLLLARGLARGQVSAKGYWVRGRPNAQRGEPELPS